MRGKACKKEYEQIVRTPFVVGRGFISRRFIKFMLFVAAAPRHRPTMLSVKSALWKTPLEVDFLFMFLTKFQLPFTASFRYDRAIDGINNKSVIERKADQKILLHIIGATVDGQCSACERCFDIADNIADIP